MPRGSEEDKFPLIREQIDIEIQAAEKFYENQLFHRALRRYEEAIQLMKHLSSAELETISADYLKVEKQRALIFLILDNPSKVIDICTRLRDNQTLDKDDVFEIERLLGPAYYMAGDFTKALRLLSRVERSYPEIIRNDPSRENIIQAAKNMKINALAHLYKFYLEIGTDKLFSARELFLESQAFHLLADCDTVLGELSLYFQEQRAARFHISTALSIYASSGFKIKLAFTLLLYARLERLVGKKKKSLKLYEQAKNLYKVNNMYAFVFSILIELGHYYVDLGQPGRAQEQFLEADDTCSYLSNSYLEKVILMLNQFEYLLKTKSQHTPIREGFRNLIRILRDNNSTFMLHNTILNMLLIELHIGDLSFAEELVQELESFWMSFKDGAYPLGAYLRSSIALKNEQVAEAENHLSEAAQNLNIEGWEHFLCFIYLELATLYRDYRHDPSKTLEYFQKSLAIHESSMFYYKKPFIRATFYTLFSDPYIQFLEFALAVNNKKHILEIIERKILCDQWFAMGCDIAHRLFPGSLTLNLQKKWEKLGSLSKKILYLEGSFEFNNPYDFKKKVLFHENEISSESLHGNDFTTYSTRMKAPPYRKRLYNNLEKVKRDIIQEDDRWQNILQLNTQHVKELKSENDKKTAFVLFLVAPTKTYGLIVSNTQLVYHFTIPLERNELKKMILAYRDNISEGKQNHQTVSKLWNSLVLPFLDKLPDKTERLIIIPHDVLWQLPFHLLSKSGSYLWDLFLIEYAPCFSSFLKGQQQTMSRQRKKFRCSTFVAPGISEQLSDLANLDRISKDKNSIDDMTIVSDTLSTKEFWQTVQSSQIIIIGSKLRLFSGLPTASYFELAPSDDADRETKITIDDILEKKLEHTDIVIFPNINNESEGSAIYCGEAILSRAWLHAGVPTLLYSLWPADPVAVSLFIQYFLKNKNKMNLRQAIRNAALSLRKSGNFLSERDWAPLSFVGYGGYLVRETRKRLFFRGGKS